MRGRDIARNISWNLSWIVLAFAWLGPLPYWAQLSFAAHMALHMLIVAVAAPLMALALAGHRFDPVGERTILFSPVVASVGELLVVWAWHAPDLHHFARFTTGGFVLEQALFLAAGLWIWLAAFGGPRPTSQRRCAAGVAALFLTTMHMTILGALLAVSPRVLYEHSFRPSGLTALADQHLGGAIMLVLGGASFLCGGLVLSIKLVRSPEGHPATRWEPQLVDTNRMSPIQQQRCNTP